MKPALRKKISRPAAAKGHEPAFREIIGLIQSARRRAFQATRLVSARAEGTTGN